MFVIGDRVVYGSMGVCTVTGKCVPEMAGATRECYVLVPEYVANSKIYVPIEGTPVSIRPIMSQRQVHAMIDGMPDVKTLGPIKEKQLQQEAYRETIQSTDSGQLVQLLKTLHLRRKQGMQEKKSVPIREKEQYDTVRRLVFGEIASVVGIPMDEVEAYIGERLTARGHSAYDDII